MSNAAWFDRASTVLPAGGFGNFDHSIFIKRGLGARVWDEDGNELIDYPDRLRPDADRPWPPRSD